jgi:hypothetical protein
VDVVPVEAGMAVVVAVGGVALPGGLVIGGLSVKGLLVVRGEATWTRRGRLTPTTLSYPLVATCGCSSVRASLFCMYSSNLSIPAKLFTLCVQCLDTCSFSDFNDLPSVVLDLSL